MTARARAAKGTDSFCCNPLCCSPCKGYKGTVQEGFWSTGPQSRHWQAPGAECFFCCPLLFSLQEVTGPSNAKGMKQAGNGVSKTSYWRLTTPPPPLPPLPGLSCNSPGGGGVQGPPPPPPPSPMTGTARYDRYSKQHKSIDQKNGRGPVTETDIALVLSVLT